jgi:deoxyribodipyrimidine photo-lyase
LRIHDNTALIYQLKNEENVIPIFIFPPEQIDPKKNTYFSNNSVQFMIESLHELSNDIKDKKGKLYFFKGDNIKVLKAIEKKLKIKSISWNIDYTPYARKRDNLIKEWCNKNKIIVYEKEDYVLYDILNKDTLKKDGTPYQVFTPFKNYCMNNLKVREIDGFRTFNFRKVNELNDIKYNIEEKEIDSFYIDNPNINVHGGRSNGLKILNNIDKFKNYQKERDFLTYKTTFLGAHNHFTTVSIREVYHKMHGNSGLINELHWRDFYINITYYFPHVLKGQINGKNKSFKEKYDNIKWSSNKLFQKWCDGETGFPIIDAAMKQLNETGFQHNRCRMITSSFLVKDLHIDWKLGEQYFASKLVDYSPIQNNGGWQWSASTGTDSQPYFRIFNPWSQVSKFDPDYEYIKKWLPELKDVPNKELDKWYKPEIHEKWLKQGIKYFKPIIDHDIERKITLDNYKEALK